MKKWSKYINIEGELCTMYFELDKNGMAQDNIVEIIIRDSTDKIIARGSYEDEAYNDAREEILAKKK